MADLRSATETRVIELRSLAAVLVTAVHEAVHALGKVPAPGWRLVPASKELIQR